MGRTNRHSKTIILTAGVFLFLAMTPRQAEALVAEKAGKSITELGTTIRELKNSIEGVGRFIVTLGSVVKKISSIIDPAVLGLLIGVLVFSAGFSAIGIPRGLSSFIISLLAVDGLWILWSRSMSPGDMGFLWTMAKANLYLVIPVCSVIMAKAVLKSMSRKLKWSLSGKVRRLLGKGRMETRKLAQYSDILNGAGATARSSLERDINNTTDDTAVISPESRQQLNELKDIVQKLLDS